MRNLFYILGLSLIIYACDPDQQNNKALWVEVNGEVLKKSEVMAALPENISSEDSLRLVNEYTKNWVKQQLLVQKAELNVGNNPEIRELVDKYKQQLLIENYLRLLVEHKAEIQPSEEQISAFYEANKDQYKLPENLLKGIFIVLPLDASNKDILKELLKADETDKATIEAYCLQNAAKVDFFTEEWIPFRLIRKHLPELQKSEKRVLSERPFYETEDTVFQYILRIDDYEFEGQTSPLSYVQKELEDFLLNANKVDYLQKMEKDLYDEALRKGLIQYYE